MGHASALVGSVLIVWGGDTKTNGGVRTNDKQDDGLYLLNLGEKYSASLHRTGRNLAQFLANGLGLPSTVLRL